MNFEPFRASLNIGGSLLSIETGVIGSQSNGAIIIRSGETTVFSSVCASPTSLTHGDTVPLTVVFQAKFSSAGKTPSGFIKHDGKLSEDDILTSRLIDRPIRPLFPKGYIHETQIISYVWSYDGAIQPDVLAICASSLALVISDIPFEHAIGAVRVSLRNGVYQINPTVQQCEGETLNIVIAGTKEKILMLEGQSEFASPEEIHHAMSLGMDAIKEICLFFEEIQLKIGKPKFSFASSLPSIELFDRVKAYSSTSLYQLFGKGLAKAELNKELSLLKKETISTLTEEGLNAELIAHAFYQTSTEILNQYILETGIRADGRHLRQVRPISIQTSLLPRTHGSALFTRGETQSLAVCTIGNENMGQRYEDLDTEGIHRFYLHYSFPPFSVGEVGRIGPRSRREIGHGKLAEKALLPILPAKNLFPQVIRLESNITSCNGSSSMASVCGGSLALRDAGVPIQKLVGGIAMGIAEREGKLAILSDISGLEDAHAWMDFKIAGDGSSITAIQMDLKNEGISLALAAQIMTQANEGITHILQLMQEASPVDKAISVYAPRIKSFTIKNSKIGALIGPGGKNIRAITEQTKVEIHVDDSGQVQISSPSKEALDKAEQMIRESIGEESSEREPSKVLEIGQIYEGEITSVVPFGVFVRIFKQEGLCHISELSQERLEKIDGLFKVGQKLLIKVIGTTDQGKLRLSHIAAVHGTEGKQKSSEPRQIIEVGLVAEGTVTAVKPFGLLIKIGNRIGLCHISELGVTSDQLEQRWPIGTSLNVEVINVNDKGQFNLRSLPN